MVNLMSMERVKTSSRYLTFPLNSNVHPHDGVGNHINWRLFVYSIVQHSWHGSFDTLGREGLLSNDKDRHSGRRAHHQQCGRHHTHLYHCQECPTRLRASSHELRGDANRNSNLHAAWEGADNGSVSRFKKKKSSHHPIYLPIKTSVATQVAHRQHRC